jgi:hypothetical protein
MPKNTCTDSVQPKIRLVIKYSDSDGCTYDCTVVEPVLYASAEAFAVDFEEYCLKNRHEAEGEFAGIEFCPWKFFEDDKYYGPDVLTVDEWFADAK